MLQNGKNCKICQVDKPHADFAYKSGSSDRLQYACRECCATKNRLYYTKNKDLIDSRNKKWESKNREVVKEAHRIRYANDAEKFRKQSLAYARAHRESTNVRNKNRRRTDVTFRIICNLRGRLAKAIASNAKRGSAVADLGCSVEFFKQYIEHRFKPGMAWSTWGRRTWHLDHIRPLSSFDLTNPEQLKTATHYSNLQPLWAHENLSKGARNAVRPQ